METRLVVAYALMALLAAALAFGLWWLVSRDRRRTRRYIAAKARLRASPRAESALADAGR